MKITQVLMPMPYAFLQKQNEIVMITATLEKWLV